MYVCMHAFVCKYVCIALVVCLFKVQGGQKTGTNPFEGFYSFWERIVHKGCKHDSEENRIKYNKLSREIEQKSLQGSMDKKRM